MSMERHRCKLCSRFFSNGRALGGHMRSHLTTLPLPPKRKTELYQLQLGDRTESDSSSTHSNPEKLTGYYGLRENPKRSVKALDPEFLDNNAGSVVVQDRESETESTQNPTRRRSSKRACGQRPACGSHTPPIGFVIKSESANESTPVSSVSDTRRSQDEEVALCLMMLSRDVWVINEDNSVESTELLLTRPGRGRKFKCLGCKKVFKTNKALRGHKAISKDCKQEMKYECPFCYKLFGSGQALGGHKRSHLIGSSSNNIINVVPTNNTNNNTNNNDNDNNISTNVDKVGDTCSFILDLNLPAPVEDDEDHSYLDFHSPN